MSNSFQVIEARVWIDPTARTFPFWEGYRPHLVARGSTDYAGVCVQNIVAQNDLKAVLPGQVAIIEFALVYLDEQVEETVELYRGLKVGADFEIREGAKTVGFGCVINRFVKDGRE